jgi:hypothetical protein
LGLVVEDRGRVEEEREGTFVVRRPMTTFAEIREHVLT